MSRRRPLATLALNDLRLIGRDRFILGIGAYILLMAFVIRLILPGLSESLLRDRGFDLVPLYPLVASYLSVILGALLCGMVFGFTLLEAREDGTMRAMLVSPLPRTTQVGYRIAAPIVCGWIIIPAMALVVGAAVPPWTALVGISLVGALPGGALALFLAAFSDNKVHAFALSKMLSGSGLIVIGRLHRTHEVAAKRAVRLLQVNNIPIIGCMVVGRDMPADRYGYGYGYGSGYNYNYYQHYYNYIKQAGRKS